MTPNILPLFSIISVPKRFTWKSLQAASARNLGKKLNFTIFPAWLPCTIKRRRHPSCPLSKAVTCRLVLPCLVRVATLTINNCSSNLRFIVLIIIVAPIHPIRLKTRTAICHAGYNSNYPLMLASPSTCCTRKMIVWWYGTWHLIIFLAQLGFSSFGWWYQLDHCRYAYERQYHYRFQLATHIYHYQ